MTKYGKFGHGKINVDNKWKKFIGHKCNSINGYLFMVIIKYFALVVYIDFSMTKFTTFCHLFIVSYILLRQVGELGYGREKPDKTRKSTMEINIIKWG